MLSGAGAGFVAALPMAAFAQSQQDAALDALLTEWFYDNVERNPTFATSLGIDKDDRAHLAGQFADLSLEAEEADKARDIARWNRIRDWPATNLSDSMKVTLAVSQFQAETAAMRAELPFAGSPYIVAQNGGAYFNVPDFMTNQHRLETTADAEAF